MFNTNDTNELEPESPLSNPTLTPQVEPKSDWLVPPEQIGVRLDRFLCSLYPDLSRTAVQQLIANSHVEVNGKTGKSGYPLRANDQIHVVYTAPSSQQKSVRPQDLPLDIIYEDTDLLVINKAAGMVVHPAPGHSDDTLVNALVARFPELQQDDGDQRPGIVHRLDRDTSGLILIARNLPTQSALIEQMQRHEVIKRYLALVEGLVSLDKGSIDAPIGRNPRNRQQMTIILQDGREARTHFRVLERFSHHTLLLLQLETGRTHQIRVHLQAIGYHIVGDPVYGSGRTQPLIQLSRQFLHAYQLEFVHPTTGVTLKFEAPLPDDLASILEMRDQL
jgi:23S rRNA pseudouridine1911/1915/1917 synthase